MACICLVALQGNIRAARLDGPAAPTVRPHLRRSCARHPSYRPAGSRGLALARRACRTLLDWHSTSMLLTGCSPATVLNFLAWRHGVEIDPLHRLWRRMHGERSMFIGRRAVTERQSSSSSMAARGRAAASELYQFVGQRAGAAGLCDRGPRLSCLSRGALSRLFSTTARSAVRWAKDNAARFGGDPNKLFIMGHSAGAYIAAMLALDDCWLGKVDLAPDRDIAGLIGISGPYDFLPLRDGNAEDRFSAAPTIRRRSRSPMCRPARRRRCW